MHVSKGLLPWVVVATAVFTQPALGQLVVGNAASGTAAEIKLLDLSGSNPSRVLVSGTPVAALSGGLDVDNTTPVLYLVRAVVGGPLSKAPLSTGSGPLATPAIVGPVAGLFTGLTWDSSSNQLIGQSASGIGRVSTADGLMSIDFLGRGREQLVGITYDSTTDAYYAVIASNLTVLEGPGVYRITKPLTAPAITRVAPLPQNGDTGINRVTVGDGRLFLARGSNSTTFPRMYVYHLAAGVYEDNAPVVTFANTGGSSVGLAWVPGLITPTSGVDLAVTCGASDECTVPVGSPLVFSVHVTNYGATASGAATVTVTLPPSSVATFANSTPAPTSVSPTQLTYTLAPLAGSGASIAYADIKINLTAVSAGATAMIAVTATDLGDAVSSNNSATASTSVQPTASSRLHKGLISTLRSSTVNVASTLLPGTANTRILSIRPNDRVASVNGQWAGFVCTPNGLTETATSGVSKAIVRVPVNGAPETLAQTYVTSTPTGTLRDITNGIDIGDSGHIAFFGRGTEANPQFVGMVNTTGVSMIAREGGGIPSVPGVTYSTGFTSLNMLADGMVSFFDTSSSDGGQRCFAQNGNSVLLHRGVTTPVGASGPIGNIATSGFGDVGTQFSSDGSHYIYSAASPAGPSYLVVDNTVVIENGVTVLPRTTQPANGQGGFKSRIAPDGQEWIAFPSSESVDTGSLPHVIARGKGSLITATYKTGDPIVAGSSETWAYSTAFGNASFPRSFLSADLSDNGHYVIVGAASGAGLYSDVAVAYDGIAIVAREGDPIDVDGNGIFDDDAYIRDFGTQVALMNDDSLYATVNFRAGKSALCQASDLTDGTALIRIQLPITGACCNGTTCTMVLSATNCTDSGGTYLGDRSGCVPTVTCSTPSTVYCCRGTTCNSVMAGTCTGIIAGSNSIARDSCGAGNAFTSCCFADYNHDGTQSIDDLFLYFNAYFTNSPMADFGGTGASQPTIDDLFLYINAYFGTCS